MKRFIWVFFYYFLFNGLALCSGTIALAISSSDHNSPFEGDLTMIIIVYLVFIAFLNFFAVTAHDVFIGNKYKGE